MKKIIFVAGARPNFMKIAPVLRELNKNYIRSIDPVLVHTGQHYDEKMSGDFFRTLGIKKPDFNLEVGSCSHAEQTARIMVGFEKVCIDIKPNLVVVVGDVNSTIATALVAKKLHINLVHIEAGLRSGDRSMPEEINRLATDAIADLFFVTEKEGYSNLIKEGHNKENIHFVGHVMIDNLFYQLKEVGKVGSSKKIEDIKSRAGDNYACLTMHRPSNVDDKDVLKCLIETLNIISKDLPIIFPCHPRTRLCIEKFGLMNNLSKQIILIDPLDYNDFLFLWRNSKFVLTDSGGLQEETTALGIPCITLRENTERPITVDVGTNTLVGHDSKKTLSVVNKILSGKYKKGLVPELWDGRASERICKILFES